MMKYEQFEEFYRKNGFCINDLSREKRKNELNIKQLFTRYEKYLKSELKIKEKIQENQEKVSIKLDKKFKENRFINQKWLIVCSNVDLRDGGKCRLIECLDYDEFQELKINAFPFYKKIDYAHIFRRSEAPNLVYVVDNVISLNRFSHNCLDQYKHPLNGKCISKDEYINWWVRIVGMPLYKALLEQANNKIIT